MKIAKSSTYRYLGFKDGYHHLENHEHGGFEFVAECKFIDVSADAVFMLKADGTIEPSYSTQRKFGQDKIQELYQALRA